MSDKNELLSRIIRGIARNQPSRWLNGMDGLSAISLLVVSLLSQSAWATPPSAPAIGGTVTGTVAVHHMGKPKKDASHVVVYIVGFNQPPPQKSAPVLGQRKKQFTRRLLAITAGQKVDFPNGDTYFHNVFSLSKTRKFDLGQYKNGRSKAKRFPRKGIVEVYCNIHPAMSATILVLPNRAFAMTDKSGRFHIENIPAGTWTIYAYNRHVTRPTRQKGIVVVSGKATTVSGLKLDENRPPRKHMNKYGQAYKKRNAKY